MNSIKGLYPWVISRQYFFYQGCHFMQFVKIFFLSLITKNKVLLIGKIHKKETL